MISPATTVDCGPITVEFFNDDTGKTAIDPALYLDDQTAGGGASHFFSVLYSEDVSKKGSYPFKYRVYYSDYPANESE